jgi:hypothetical protein
MAVDPLSPIAPARLKALLLPVGRIKRSRFLSFAARLQAENVVRLGDISPNARPNRSRHCRFFREEERIQQVYDIGCND